MVGKVRRKGGKIVDDRYGGDGGRENIVGGKKGTEITGGELSMVVRRR